MFNYAEKIETERKNHVIETPENYKKNWGNILLRILLQNL